MSNQTKQLISDLIQISSQQPDPDFSKSVYIQKNELSTAIEDIKKIIEFDAHEEREFFLTKKSKLKELEQQRLMQQDADELHKIQSMILDEERQKYNTKSNEHVVQEQAFETIGFNTLKIIDDMSKVRPDSARFLNNNKIELSLIIFLLALSLSFLNEKKIESKKTNIILPEITTEQYNVVKVNDRDIKVFKLCENDLKIDDSCITPDYTDLILDDILNKSIISNKSLNLDKSGLTGVKKDKAKVIKTTIKKGKDRFNVDTTGF